MKRVQSIDSAEAFEFANWLVRFQRAGRPDFVGLTITGWLLPVGYPIRFLNECIALYAPIEELA
jgi:hypothetical protein